VMRCPLLRIVELEDRGQADAWIDACIAGGFDHLVLLTGDGLRHLLALCGPRRGAFIAALTKLRLITRGPKPVRALREIGLTPDVTAPEPTSASILGLLLGEGVTGRRIGVQLYPGDGALSLVRGLQDHGATVFAVTPYRYANQSETGAVAAAIESLAAGAVDMIAFTASPQVERLFAVARETGLEDALRSGLGRTPVAAIGPVVEEALHARGIARVIRPESSFHLKPLLRAMAGWRAS
jgi:uroporphyrinogen-III synthase